MPGREIEIGCPFVGRHHEEDRTVPLFKVLLPFRQFFQQVFGRLEGGVDETEQRLFSFHQLLHGALFLAHWDFITHINFSIFRIPCHQFPDDQILFNILRGFDIEKFKTRQCGSITVSVAGGKHIISLFQLLECERELLHARVVFKIESDEVPILKTGQRVMSPIDRLLLLSHGMIVNRQTPVCFGGFLSFIKIELSPSGTTKLSIAFFAKISYRIVFMFIDIYLSCGIVDISWDIQRAAAGHEEDVAGVLIGPAKFIHAHRGNRASVIVSVVVDLDMVHNPLLDGGSRDKLFQFGTHIFFQRFSPRPDPFVGNSRGDDSFHIHIKRIFCFL